MRFFSTLLFGFCILLFSGQPGQAACPAPPVGNVADTVIQMRAHGGNAGMGPTTALNATEEGALIYDDANDTVKVCDGTNWVDISGGGGATGCAYGDFSIWDGSGWVCSGTAEKIVVCRFNFDTSYCKTPTGCFTHDNGVQDDATSSIAWYYGINVSLVSLLSDSNSGYSCGGSGHNYATYRAIAP